MTNGRLLGCLALPLILVSGVASAKPPAVAKADARDTLRVAQGLMRVFEGIDACYETDQVFGDFTLVFHLAADGTAHDAVVTGIVAADPEAVCIELVTEGATWSAGKSELVRITSHVPSPFWYRGFIETSSTAVWPALPAWLR